MCPKGDDPITVDQNYKVFLLTVTGGGAVSGTLGLEFYGRTSYISLSPASSSDCVAGLEASGSYGFVACDATTVAVDNIQFKITIYSWPLYPAENNLYSHDGNPDISQFMCDTSQTSGFVSCNFTDIVNTNIRGKEEKA
jgi:hypothetical protein